MIKINRLNKNSSHGRLQGIFKPQTDAYHLDRNMGFSLSNKKGQEEIVGFVAIVLIVSIMMIVFLGIFLRKDKTGTGNVETSQFLDALMETTTSCSNNGGFSFKRYSELVKFCNEGGLCDGKNSCEVLKNYTKEMIEKSWKFGNENTKKGYIYEMKYTSEESNEIELFVIDGKGPAGTTKYVGSKREIQVNDGVIEFELKIYLE